MKLSIGDMLQPGRAGGWSSIFGGAGRGKQAAAAQGRVGEIGRKLDRNSVELHKTRLTTRRCSLENSKVGGGSSPASPCEELLCVIPRQDSITLAKRRLSHDVHAAADTAAAAAAAGSGNDSPTHSADSSASNCWQITASEQQQQAAASSSTA